MRTTQKALTEPGKAAKRNNPAAPMPDLFSEEFEATLKGMVPRAKAEPTVHVPRSEPPKHSIPEKQTAASINRRPRLLTVAEASEYLGLSKSTLNKWRCIGEGPSFRKLGRAIRYLQTDLDAFIEAQHFDSTAGY